MTCHHEPGWPALFWAAFSHSASSMLLLDRECRIVEVNAAHLALTAHPREALIGRPFVDFVLGGRWMTESHWRALIVHGDFAGSAELLRADGGVVGVRFSAHAEAGLGVLVAAAAAETGQRAHHRVTAGEAPAALTARQRQIVELIALGATGPEIAARLQLSHHTVRAHVNNAKTRLGVRSRAQLVMAALPPPETAAHPVGRRP